MGQSSSVETTPAPLVGGQQESATEPGKKDDGITWWCRILVKVVCVVSSGLAIFLGVWELLTFSPKCLVAGIFMMLMGFFVIVLEAPFCCTFLDFIQPLTRFSENRSYWGKAAIYAIPPFFPFLLCHTLTVIMGCALLMCSGVTYGMLALGRKADRDTMLTRAGKGEEPSAVELNEVVPSQPSDSPEAPYSFDNPANDIKE